MQEIWVGTKAQVPSTSYEGFTRVNRIQVAFEGFSSPCVHIMKISSMNLHQMNGSSEELSMACCSNLPMNKLAYEGAIRVPIAVPLLNEKLFIVRIILMRSQIYFQQEVICLGEC